MNHKSKKGGKFAPRRGRPIIQTTALADAMRRTHTTTADIVALCNVSRSTVTRWVAGTTIPRADHAATLANHFGRSVLADWMP